MEEGNRNRNRPLILVVNDDGIEADGLKAAIRAAQPYGDLLIAAPAKQQTAMGRAYPRYDDLGVIEPTMLNLGNQKIQAYAVHSSPAHAVCYGAMELADRKPDLLVSGINHGANVGMTVTCSGTIGACLEAVSEGIPAIALSLETDSDVIMNARTESDFRYAEKAGAKWIEHILNHGMPDDCSILNVNVPNCPVEPDEYRITCLDRQNYYQMVSPPSRDWSQRYTMDFQIEVDVDTLTEGSDIEAMVVKRKISVTPLTWDLTLRRTLGGSHEIYTN
ncbi:MAG: 5'/3'-nucleotidase SurE [Firmicutes bacterium]|nr:5'/3'-nucleotidase SurE [Bacillota bacterium]